MLHRKVYCLTNACSLDSIVGKVVRHKCDNPRCINPDHLTLGEQSDNVRDTMRQANSRVTTRVMTAEEVASARAAYSGEYGEQTKMAKEYGVSRLAMHQILREKRR